MTEVALDTATPHAPSVIRLLLDKLGIAYREVTDHPLLPSEAKVQAVLLDDAVGALMVLFPQNQLLDLSHLTELTGRKLIAVPLERLEQMLKKHGLTILPAIPALTSSPCLYEERLLKQPALLIHSGHPGLLLEIQSTDFKQMLTKASAGHFGVLLSEIRPNLDRPADDSKEITEAVQAFTARRIQQRLESTIEIPPLAETAQKIIKLRVDPNATIDDITGVVETDPALAAQVVSWAASPYYASPGKIRSVEDAIVRVLGFDLVINLALGLALGKTLSLPKDHPQQTTPYWQQSIYTAAVIEGLTRAMPRAERPESGLTYLAGLLHNFGYLLLAHVCPPHFSLICRHLEVNPQLDDFLRGFGQRWDFDGRFQALLDTSGGKGLHRLGNLFAVIGRAVEVGPDFAEQHAEVPGTGLGQHLLEVGALDFQQQTGVPGMDQQRRLLEQALFVKAG